MSSKKHNPLSCRLSPTPTAWECQESAGSDKLNQGGQLLDQPESIFSHLQGEGGFSQEGNLTIVNLVGSK